MARSIGQLLAAGVSAHKEADFREAERLYRMILEVDPRHSHAHHHLGMIAAAQDRVDLAIPHFRIALEERPEEDICWISFIDALIRDEQAEAAQKALAGAEKSGVVGPDELAKFWAQLDNVQ